jgi:hypothetical protein
MVTESIKEDSVDMVFIPEKYTKDFWKKLDNLFDETINYAEKAFKINSYVNIIVVSTGVILILYSIYFSWFNNLDIYTITLSTLGISSFILLFFIAPQRRVQDLVGDLTQIQLFYRTYLIQWEHIADWQRENREKMTLEELRNLNKQLEELTINIAAKIGDLTDKELM